MLIATALSERQRANELKPDTKSLSLKIYQNRTGHSIKAGNAITYIAYQYKNRMKRQIHLNARISQKDN